MPIINDADRNPHVNHKALDEFINSGSWDWLRLGHMPIGFLDGDRCKRTCMCPRGRLSMDVCTPSVSCGIRSTVAYMVAVRRSIVDDILNADGTIDDHMFQGFKQSYVVPATVRQRKKLFGREV